MNKNLLLGPKDPAENIRRIGEVAKLFTMAGVITLTAVISPTGGADRERPPRALLGTGANSSRSIVEPRPIEVCEARDPKACTRKARAGQLKAYGNRTTP